MTGPFRLKLAGFLLPVRLIEEMHILT
jgi:hypothetical protein